jgi:hypothetical protein
MAMIEIEPPREDADVAGLVRKALEVLRQANIGARRRSRSLKTSGLVQVPDEDAEQAINVLLAAIIRASIRPS